MYGAVALALLASLGCWGCSHASSLSPEAEKALTAKYIRADNDIFERWRKGSQTAMADAKGPNDYRDVQKLLSDCRDEQAKLEVPPKLSEYNRLKLEQFDVQIKSFDTIVPMMESGDKAGAENAMRDTGKAVSDLESQIKEALSQAGITDEDYKRMSGTGGKT